MSVKSRETRVKSRSSREEREARSEVRSTLLAPRFPLPAPRLPRLGLSLTEVLISMGILTLGLLGVASVFPVGSFYMQKAEISDKASAIAQSVMSDIVTQGMLNPNSWYVMVPMPGVPSSPEWKIQFPSDGASSPNGKVNGAFTRPFARALGEALLQTSNNSTIAKQFGSAFVIDPLAIATMAGTAAPANAKHGPAAVFPAAAYSTYASNAAIPSWSASPWLAWCGPSAAGYQWPIRRVTFRQSSTGWHMDSQMAEHYFRGNDDLSFDFPQRADRPAFQSWDISSSGLPLARKWMGDYSWIVTVAPSTNAARNGMATNPEGFAYDVSVVVFYKRVLPENADSAFNTYGTNGGVYQSVMNQNERAVKANIVSTGLNGGELLLTDLGDYRDTSNVQKFNAFEHLKSGHWIMLCGPHPNSSAAEPRFVMNWYQVISIESEAAGIPSFDRIRQRVVTVRGPEWPWQPPTSLSDTTNVSNNLSVAICKGAVAVHTKSMRLEGRGSAFSLSNGGAANGGAGGDGGFGGSGNPGSAPPPYTLH